MHEVLPGVWHWREEHPVIRAVVHSYWLDDGATLIDPLVPVDEGLEWFAGRSDPPRAIVLSNRHHYRQSDQFVERFGCSVHAPRPGLHEFTHRGPVLPYDPGDELAGGLIVHEIDSICPDDMALYRPSSRAVWFADGLVRGGPPGSDGPLGFVPDSLMDDPERTKRGLLEAFARLLDRAEFDHVMMAHGDPVIGAGSTRLEDLLRHGGRTAFEM